MKKVDWGKIVENVIKKGKGGLQKISSAIGSAFDDDEEAEHIEYGKVTSGPRKGQYVSDIYGKEYDKPLSEDEYKQKQGMAPMPPLQSDQRVPTPEPTATPTTTTDFGARNPDSGKPAPSSEVVDAINKAANKYAVPASLLFDIAWQESKYDAKSKASEHGFDGDKLPHSSAEGLFQFTDGTWDTVQNYANMEGSSLNLPSTNRSDPYASAMATAYLIRFGQLARWDASKDVWGKYYDEAELSVYYGQDLKRKPQPTPLDSALANYKKER